MRLISLLRVRFLRMEVEVLRMEVEVLKVRVLKLRLELLRVKLRNSFGMDVRLVTPFSRPLAALAHLSYYHKPSHILFSPQ